MLALLQLAASLAFVLSYVWASYTPMAPGSPRWALDLGLSAFFAAEYAHRIWTSPHPLRACLQPLNVVDLVSFLPCLLESAAACALPPSLAGALRQLVGAIDLRWARIFRVLRLLRLALLTGNLPSMRMSRSALLSGAFNVRLLQLVASVLALIFTSASFIHLLERMPWHDALYFVVTTLATVGYGDIVPKSLLAKMTVVAMIALGAVLIPVRTSQLYTQLLARRITAGPLPSGLPGARPYVLLSTRLTEVRGFSDMATEFFHQVGGVRLCFSCAYHSCPCHIMRNGQDKSVRVCVDN